jgi:hypothetical protein
MKLHHAVFSNLLPFHPSSVQIFSLAPCSQTPSVYVLPFMSELKLYPYKTTGKITAFYILIFTFSDGSSACHLLSCWYLPPFIL